MFRGGSIAISFNLSAAYIIKLKKRGGREIGKIFDLQRPISYESRLRANALINVFELRAMEFPVDTFSIAGITKDEHSARGILRLQMAFAFAIAITAATTANMAGGNVGVRADGEGAGT